MKTNYCIFPNWLTDSEADWLRESSRVRPHMRCDVNGIGWRWRSAATDEEVACLLSNDRRERLARALGLQPAAVRAMVPRYWDSVLRGPGDRLITHNDYIPEDRVIALAYYANRRWREDWGGEFVFHSSLDPRESSDLVIPPIPNTLVAFVVEEYSHHTVLPVLENVYRHAFVGWLNGSRVHDPGYKSPPAPRANTKITYNNGDSWAPGYVPVW